MSSEALRRLSLRLFIAFLCFAALLAIIAVLGGGFGEIQLKIILSSLALAGANVCAMSCAAYLQRRSRSPLPVAGIACAVLAALLVIGGLWAETTGDVFWKTAFSFVVVSVALSHACGLLIPRLASSSRPVQYAGVAGAGLLALLILIPLWGEVTDSGYYRFLAVAVIITVLLSLLVPLLARLKPADPASDAPGRKLVLSPAEDGLYRDESGTLYEVKPVSGPPAD